MNSNIKKLSIDIARDIKSVKIQKNAFLKQYVFTINFVGKYCCHKKIILPGQVRTVSFLFNDVHVLLSEKNSFVNPPLVKPQF